MSYSSRKNFCTDVKLFSGLGLSPSIVFKESADRTKVAQNVLLLHSQHSSNAQPRTILTNIIHAFDLWIDVPEIHIDKKWAL